MMLLGGASTVKYKSTFHLVSLFCLFGVMVATLDASAQSVAYRQTNLASSTSSVANHVTQGLTNPWGLGFFSGQPFFVANNGSGKVVSHDAAGASAGLPSFTVPDAAGTGLDNPTGIIADQNALFGGPTLVRSSIVVSDQGRVFTWAPDAHGSFPQQATLVVDNSARGAVYKGVAILTSPLSAPALAVTDFKNGSIDTFLPGFAAVALVGSFTDPNLPAGYAPFGIQVIGTQVFVTYALQDVAKHDPIAGAGNGIVTIFDMDGNFVRRFATGGGLNAPWGVTHATANFGPFSNDILIGNVGDGAINAFDPTTGAFKGELLDGDGVAISETGLHALAFRADGFGNPDTLYFTSQLHSAQDGLFGALTTGLVSAIRVGAPDTPANISITITANVAAGAGNRGTPTGNVTFLDASTRLGSAPLVNDAASVNAVLTGVRVHDVVALYSGDATFLSSTAQIPLQVTGPATAASLTGPATASQGAVVALTATITAQGVAPTGNVQFLDTFSGTSHVLGQAALNTAGIATLNVNLAGAGAHSLTVSYDGNGTLGASDSKVLLVNVSSKDFSLGSSSSIARVTAGQSVPFTLTVTGTGGFADAVTFTCSPVTGITCSFSPASVTPTNGSANTTLTVMTSSTVPRYGPLALGLFGPGFLVAGLGLIRPVKDLGRKARTLRASMLTATAATVILGLTLALSGCGGYGGNSQPNRGTATIIVTAHSGAISHTTTLNITVQ
jgi:uncharacterized protein (TIGR03118 family)